MFRKTSVFAKPSRKKSEGTDEQPEGSDEKQEGSTERVLSILTPSDRVALIELNHVFSMIHLPLTAVDGYSGGFYSGEQGVMRLTQVSLMRAVEAMSECILFRSLHLSDMRILIRSSAIEIVLIQSLRAYSIENANWNVGLRESTGVPHRLSDDLFYSHPKMHFHYTRMAELGLVVDKFGNSDEFLALLCGVRAMLPATPYLRNPEYVEVIQDRLLIMLHTYLTNQYKLETALEIYDNIPRLFAHLEIVSHKIANILHPYAFEDSRAFLFLKGFVEDSSEQEETESKEAKALQKENREKLISDLDHVEDLKIQMERYLAAQPKTVVKEKKEKSEVSKGK